MTTYIITIYTYYLWQTLHIVPFNPDDSSSYPICWSLCLHLAMFIQQSVHHHYLVHPIEMVTLHRFHQNHNLQLPTSPMAPKIPVYYGSISIHLFQWCTSAATLYYMHFLLLPSYLDIQRSFSIIVDLSISPLYGYSLSNSMYERCSSLSNSPLQTLSSAHYLTLSSPFQGGNHLLFPYTLLPNGSFYPVLWLRSPCPHPIRLWHLWQWHSAVELRVQLICSLTEHIMNKYLNFPHLHGIREATYGLSILQLLLQLPGLDPPSGHGGPHNQKDPAMIQQTSVINLVSQVRVILCHQQNVANLQCLDNVGLPIYLLPLAEVKTSGDSSSLSGSQTNSIIYLLPPVLVHVSSPPDPSFWGC